MEKSIERSNKKYEERLKAYEKECSIYKTIFHRMMRKEDWMIGKIAKHYISQNKKLNIKK